MTLALITGGAHRLGGAFAEHLAERGYDILLHYHRSESLARQRADVLRGRGARVWMMAADLRQPEAVEALFAFADALPAELEVLINSAARMTRGDVQTLSAADWDETLALNLRAPLLCVQRAAARMRMGLIVNISDVGASKLWTQFPAYVVSKSALETLTRLQARALAPHIRVNAIAPGLVLPSDDLSAAEWERLLHKTPSGRPVALADILSALDYLLDTPSVTGQILTVDGGYALV